LLALCFLTSIPREGFFVAKNYKAIYDNTGDSTAQNQRFYIKEESVRGALIAPGNADFFYTLGGSAVNFSQAFGASPVRSGRHNKNVIREKKMLEWSIVTHIDVDTTQVSAGFASFPPALRLLFKSLLGFEGSTPVPKFNSSTDPSVTFSIHEVGDMWSKQAPGCFVQGCEVSLPGDGVSQLSWSGNGKESFTVGIGKTIVSNNGANTVTVGLGEGKRFPVGSQVMLIENDGVTRSADTPVGTPRKVTSVSGDVVTIDGAVLADADGSTTPQFLCYYEPDAPVAIDNPQVGLVGTFVSTTVPGANCIRSATVSIQNNHELVDYCWGKDSLSGALFVAASRLEVNATIEMNLNHELIEFYNSVQKFEVSDLQFNLGDTASRYFRIALPKVYFNVPQISVPDSGSIPVSFEGLSVQTAEDAADEVEVRYP
jgi:hypothetical protein